MQWLYHPSQKPVCVNHSEAKSLLNDGWFETYSEIPGYVANEHGERREPEDNSVIKSDSTVPQNDSSTSSIRKQRGRPSKQKLAEISGSPLSL